MGDLARLGASGMRGRAVLQLAQGLVERGQSGLVHADVVLRRRDGGPSVTLGSETSPAAMEKVAAGNALLGAVNPLALLTVATRGVPPFRSALPLKAVAMFPSPDAMVFALRPGLDVGSLEEVARSRLPLRVSLRGVPDHGIHWVIDHVLATAGLTLADLRAWGGETLYEPGTPDRSGRLEALVEGRVDAVFDEAAEDWLGAAVEGGCTILSLGEPAVERLESWGYRRSVLEAGAFPGLPGDVLTVDFSHWPLYVRTDASAELVRAICAIIDEKREQIRWQEEGPFPVDRMWQYLDAALVEELVHDEAAAFWRSKGYL